MFFRDFHQNFTRAFLGGFSAPLAHSHIQINEGVVFRAAVRVVVKLRSFAACSTTIGHGVVGCRIGQHAGATCGKNLLSCFVDHGQHGIRQFAAQNFHVGFCVQLTGIENDQMRH